MKFPPRKVAPALLYSERTQWFSEAVFIAEFVGKTDAIKLYSQLTTDLLVDSREFNFLVANLVGTQLQIMAESRFRWQ